MTQRTTKFFEKKKGAPPLKIIPLGGTTTVNRNLFVYECGPDIILVDCGVDFPDEDTPGVDLIIPDFSYVLENRHKVRGLLVTHGHYDHFGAIPFLLKELDVPIFSSRLVRGFIQTRIDEHRGVHGAKLNLLDERQGPLSLGCFRIDHFRVNHSVPDSLGFVIDTPQGRVFHVSDFKFDWTPVMDEPFDTAKVLDYARDEVLVLLSDCLGALRPEFTKSERFIEETFLDLLERAGQDQVIVTTVSSNISRIQQAINAARHYDRKVVFSGRSIRQNMEVARKLGYVNFPENLIVDERRSNKLPQGKLLYLVAGSYGQGNSALARIATGTHQHVKIRRNARVIFSADPIPGVEGMVNRMIDRLTVLGADVYYSEIQAGLHVSGHGCQGDLSLLASLVRPGYFIPIGGTPQHMRAYTRMLEDQGISSSRVFELLDGQGLSFQGGKVEHLKKIAVRDIYVEGSQVGETGPGILRERKALADDGMVVIIIKYSHKKQKVTGEPQIVSRGFVFMKESEKLINQMTQTVTKTLDRNKDRIKDWDHTRKQIEKDLDKFLWKETGRSPIILPVFVEV